MFLAVHQASASTAVKNFSPATETPPLTGVDCSAAPASGAVSGVLLKSDEHSA
jgi:hypothetical protein